jgi:hypothetical protein
MIAVEERTMATIPAAMRIVDDQMTVSAGDLELTAPVRRFANGERSGIATLAELAVSTSDRGYVLRCCAGCTRFWFSGLSFQFSGGTRGYCALAGGREPDAEVAIDFGCGEHQPIVGWPDDLPAMDRARMELRMVDPAPSRLPAIMGGLIGLAAAEHRAVGDVRLDVARIACDVAEGNNPPPGHHAVIGTAAGLARWRDPDGAVALARALTSTDADHRDENAEAVALLVAMVMRKRTVSDLRDALASLSITDAAIERGFARFARTPEIFEQVMRAVESENQATAAVAGALAGAFNGLASIPERWRAAAGSEMLMESARLLHRAGGSA